MAYIIKLNHLIITLTFNHPLKENGKKGGKWVELLHLIEMMFDYKWPQMILIINPNYQLCFLMKHDLNLYHHNKFPTDSLKAHKSEPKTY